MNPYSRPEQEHDSVDFYDLDDIVFDDDFDDFLSSKEEKPDFDPPRSFPRDSDPVSGHKSAEAVSFDYSGDHSATFFDDNKPARSTHRFPLWAAFVVDALLVGCSLLVFALFHHVIPQRNISDTAPVVLIGETDISPVSPSDTVSNSDGTVSESDAIPSPFTKEVTVTETSYHSPNVAITVTSGRYENADYHIQDIQLRDVSLFRTAFAEDTYGVWVTATTPDIAKQHNAICAINGDYYGASRTKGIVIRNGMVYRGNGNDLDDILVMYQDGSMETFKSSNYNEDELLSRKVWQAWSFGPSLLNSDGTKIDYFDSEIAGAHPRTVVGYYEPGHYCFITVDGRSEESNGLSFVRLSALCESLGLRIAYNLDGGRTSMMTFGDNVVNDAYLGGRECSDILYICDTAAATQNAEPKGDAQ